MNKCDGSICPPINSSKASFKSISDPLSVGTRIHWDEGTHNLYFVDVPESNVYRYNVDENKLFIAKVGSEPLAFMFPVEGSNTKFIAGLGRKFVFVEWDGFSNTVCSVQSITEVETEGDLKANRLNGAKVDPCGRLWAGTMGPSDDKGNTIPEKGSLYSVTKGVVKKHDDKIGISNGLAFDMDKKKLYYIDTLLPGVFQYDLSTNGDISNRCQIFDFKKNNIQGLPDGLTIDSSGMLWVCAIFGGVLVQVNPANGEVLQTIPTPTPQVTAVTFGNPELNKMYITTAKIPVDGKVPEPPAGMTYMIENVGVTGCKGDRYKP